MVFVSLELIPRGILYPAAHRVRKGGGGGISTPPSGISPRRPGTPPPKAGNIPAGPGILPSRPGIFPPAPVTFPTGAVIFPPAGNITVGPARLGGNITVAVKLPASGGNIPGQPVISPGVWDVLPRTGSPIDKILSGKRPICGAFSAEASHVEQHRRDVVSRALLHRGLHQPLRDLRKRLSLVLQHQRVRVSEREDIPHAV